MSKSDSNDGGCGCLLVMLGMIFITLKLAGVISWSWLWVLCPLWIGPAIILGFIATVLGFVATVLGFIALLLAVILPFALVAVFFAEIMKK